MASIALHYRQTEWHTDTNTYGVALLLKSTINIYDDLNFEQFVVEILLSIHWPILLCLIKTELL